LTTQDFADRFYKTVGNGIIQVELVFRLQV
jgi:hypothetical protein